MDGANLNALLGIVKPGEMGFDIIHFNLHKTFSTPHGGGGPGAGPIGVKKFLADFLPVPQIERKTGKSGKPTYYLSWKRKNSIGKLHSFYGNFGMFVRAYTYIRQQGGDGLRAISENAVINANYLLAGLRDYYNVAYNRICMHELVLTGMRQKAKGIRTADIAKRLLDYGVHAPTVYFPLIVPEALMIEPTESESKESLDNFIEALHKIAEEVEVNPELVRSAPHETPVGRLDEAKAAKDLDVCYKG
jgi:glycine dehydrogenase subunit 2